jgi:hypothetical protein
MNAYFSYLANTNVVYGGELEFSICTARAPDWMNNVINIDFGNRNVTYPKETFWEGAWRLLSGVDNRIGYDQYGNAYRHVQPVTGTPPIPGFGKGISIIKTGTNAIKKGNIFIKGFGNVNKDFFHRTLKNDILKAVSKGRFEKIVGGNPNITVVNGKIVLQGVGGVFKGKTYNTGLNANDFLK